MSISTSTAAERIALRDKLAITGAAMQAFAQDSIVPNTEQITEIDALLTALTTALSAADGIILPATQVVVSDTQATTVTDNSGGPSVAAVLTVTAGALVRATMSVATDCITQTGANITMQNSAGTAIPGTHPATVAAGALSNVKLASTVGVVVNAVKQSGWTVTGSGTFFTPTVAAGVCTGGVLSAS
jgi:hypothetical protein